MVEDNLTQAVEEKDTVESLQLQLQELRKRVVVQKNQILEEKRKCEDLLHNMLPDEVYHELLINGKVVPQLHKHVTVMFIDFVGFTSMCEHVELKSIIQELDSHFSQFDDICSAHYLEKIKTIGDAYLCVGGMPLPNHSHPVDSVLAAMEIMHYINDVNKRKKSRDENLWNVRIGIHTGSLIAGVVGKRKFLYDIWGDTVNVASRMESSSDEGRINISGETYNQVKHFFKCTYRGKIPVKHKDEANMYFVDGFLPKYSTDKNCGTPNKAFVTALRKL